MKTRSLAAFAFAVAIPLTDVSRSVSRQPIRPESRIWFTGASNIRHFTCKARQLSGALDLRGVATRSSVLVGENASAEPSLSMTVDSVDCGIGRMNRHLHEALQGARHPTVEFRLTSYEIDLTTPAPIARIVGAVTIAGVQRPVAATAAIRADTLGTLSLHGSYPLRLTDFSIAPPRRFGGLLRVRDSVTVHFDVAVDPDGDAVNAIACRLIELIKTQEVTHVSHP